MKQNRWIVAASAMGLVMYGALLAQAAGTRTQAAGAPEGRGAPPQAPTGRGQTRPPIKNPLDGNPDAIRTGGDTYRARCASCHGADAKGTDRGLDLTGLWAAGETDGQIFQAGRVGIENTVIPHSFGPDNTMWAVVAFLRTLNADPATSPKPGGDAAGGARVFAANCSSCHRVSGRGGRLGPDLSRVGLRRSRVLLAHKIRHASVYFVMDSGGIFGGYTEDGYQPVTLVTKQGQRIRGVRKNEDVFSIQIMDTNEHIQGYIKADLREVIEDTKSVMPDFGSDKVSDHDLDDLVAYLATLRGAEPGRQ